MQMVHNRGMLGASLLAIALIWGCDVKSARQQEPIIGPSENERNPHRTPRDQVNTDAVILPTDSVICRGGRTFHSWVNRCAGCELVDGTTRI